MASLIAQGGYYEWIVTNGENEYRSANIAGGTLTDALYQQMSVGNVIARQLNLKLWNVELDPSEPIVLSCDPGLDPTFAKGTYWIDTISKSPYSEYCEVTAFDALLKTEVIYLKEGEWTTKTALEVAQEIATDIGVALNADTEFWLDEYAQDITQAPSIGENGTTERQMLSVLGVMYGGNWIINDDNELELRILMMNAGILRINNNGNFIVSDFGAGGIPAIPFVGIDGNGDFISIPYNDIDLDDEIVFVDWRGNIAVDKAERLVYAANVIGDTVEVGDEVVSFDVSPTEYVKRVELQNNGSVMFRSPSGLTDDQWEALGGDVMTFNMPIMASQELADELLTKLGELEYVPHKATTTYIDPSLPLGSVLHIKNDYVILANRTLNIDTLGASDLSADPQQELQSNYPYLDPVVRETRQKIDQNYAAINVTISEIRSEVYTKSETDGIVASAVTQTETDLRTEFSREVQEAVGEANDYTDGKTKIVATYFNESADGLEIGKSDSPFKSLLSNTELAFTGESGEKVAWINSNQLYINEEAIPASNGKWVTTTDAQGHRMTNWVAN